MAPNASSQTIRLRVLTSLTSKGTTQNMYLCRIDPSLPCRSVISTIACLVYSKSNDHSSMDSFSNAEQGASWEHPEFGGRRFLEGYSVFYRGRPVVSQLFDSHHHQHDSSSSATTELPFGVVCPMEEGEELLIRKRTAAATAMMQVSSHQTQGEPDVLPTTATMSTTSRYQTSRMEFSSSLSTPAHQQQKQQQPRESPFLSSPQMLASGRRRVGFDSFSNNSNTFGDSGGTSLPLLLHSISTDDVPFQSTSKTTTVGALVAPRTQRQLQSALVTFLTRCGIVEWFSPFAVKAGILSLGELCTHSAESLAAVIDHATPPEDFLKAIRFPPKRKDVMIGSRRPLFPHNNHQDQHHRHARESTKQASSPLSQQNTTTMPSPSSTSAAAAAATPTFMAADWNYEVSSFPLAVFAHRLISTAHWSMKASGLVIDWPKRLRSYLLRVDPERALGSDIVESARIRALMDHDGGGASASTADIFGDHLGKKKGADRHHRGDATVDDDDDAGCGMDRGFERVWWELRRQYEEHLVQAIQDAEEKGVLLPPYMADDDDDGMMGQERRDMRDNIGNVSSQVNGLVLRAAHSANEAHAAASVSTSFLVCCPNCSHAFQYAPPSLPWQLAEFQRAVANAELASISLQKEHALREEQFSDTIQSLGAELQRLRQESKEWEEKALLEANRAAVLEGENRSFRQRLRMSDDLFGRGAFATTDHAVPPTTTKGKIVGVRTSAASRRKHGEDHSALLHQRAVVTSSHLEESIVRSDGDTSATTVPADAAVNPEEKKRIRRVLAQYLQEHNPDSLMMVDSILAQWKHREYELERVLRIPPSKAPKGLQDAAVRGWLE
ncbi:Hypothetical protein, putative [Bodo saltans]|uniref:Uncharacterized protein n=1 Tax=Bodo saltans TaxID=75058 RepID=A0A0S4IU89_BODSA|nr:Hypothetical protein, putative [Bodo saltans]|eukprot:CUG09617.1 Hypothetical protein, putative [Bodo saltans]